MDSLLEYSVCDELWETETYRQLFGQFSSPVTKPRYSDIGGVRKVSDGPNDKFPDIKIPEGWECTGDWVLWSGTAELLGDKDGWLYGKTYAELERQVYEKRDCGSERIRRGAGVRRRKWVRTRRCISVEAQEVVRAELQWLRSIVSNLKSSIRRKLEDHIRLQKFEDQRVVCYKQVRTAHAHRVIAFKNVLLKYQENLTAMKAYLKERRELDREYGRRLKRLNSTLIPAHKGQTSDGAVTDSAMGEGREGFWQMLTGTTSAVSDHLEGWASEMTNERWSDIDALLETLGSLLRKCDVEAMDLWNNTRAAERSAVDAFQIYASTYESGSRKGVSNMERIAAVLARADESHVLETSSLSGLLTGGIYGGTSGDESRSDGGQSGSSSSSSSSSSSASSGTSRRSSGSSLARDQGHGDVFACVHAYRVAVSKTMRGHDTIQRFTDFMERDTRSIATSVATVVRRATDFFCGQQGGMWSQIGREMSYRSQEAGTRANSMCNAAKELGNAMLDDVSGVNAGTGTGADAESSARQRHGSLSFGSGVGDGAEATDGSDDDAKGKRDHLDQGESEQDESSASGKTGSECEVEGEKDGQVPFHPKALPPISRAVVSEGLFMVAASDEIGRVDDPWHPVTLVATADGFVHFFDTPSPGHRGSSVGGGVGIDAGRASAEEARGLFLGEKCPISPARSVCLDRASVRLAMLAQRGEAIEINVKWELPGSMQALMGGGSSSSGGSSAAGGSGAGRASGGGGASGNKSARWTSAGKLILSAAESFEEGGGGSGTAAGTRDWIRLLHNPLADPKLAPPDLD